MAKNMKSLKEIELYFNGDKLPLNGEYFDKLGTFCNLAQLIEALNKVLPAGYRMKVEGKGSYITIKTPDYKGADKKTINKAKIKKPAIEVKLMTNKNEF